MDADRRQAGDLLSLIYGILEGSVGWDAAMGALARSMRSERIVLMSVDREGSVRQDAYPFDPAGVVEFAESYADKDVRIARILQRRLRGALTTQDLMTPEEIARCPIHNEFYRKYPECWNTLAVPVGADGGTFAPIFQRSAGMGLYAPVERHLSTELATHLLRVAHLSRLLPPSGLSSDGIVAALDGLEDGLMVFDQAGQVVHMNTAARAIASARDGIELINKVPVAAHPASRMLLSRMMVDILLVADGKRLEMPAPVALPRHPGRPPLRVRGYVAPPKEGHRRLGILTLHRDGDWRLPSIEAVRVAGGLSPAEARVAHALVSGRSLREHAEAAGLSEHTVRFQMKRVREKLGVSRQAEVVAELLRRCGSI